MPKPTTLPFAGLFVHTAHTAWGLTMEISPFPDGTTKPLVRLLASPLTATELRALADLLDRMGAAEKGEVT